MITDLTEGKPQRVLLKFTLPMLLSVMFQQLYTIADSIIAGLFVGLNALAAIGDSYPITMIFIAFANGSNIGGSVVISQLYGGKKLERMKTAVSTSLVASIVISAVLTAIGLLFSKKLLIALDTPEEIMSDSVTYLNIYIWGLVFLFLYNMCNAVFTALGDSKTPLYFLILSSVGNIILDIIFVRNFNLGVAGVAWATLTAQGFSSILSGIVLLKRIRKIKCGKYPVFKFDMLVRISKIAIPSVLQQSFVSVGNVFIQGLINSFGSAVIAGFSASMKLNTFTITTLSTLGNGISSYTAQNMGADRPDRVKKGFSSGLLIAFIVAAPFFVLLFFFPEYMMRIFVTADSTEVIASGAEFLKIVSPFYFIITVKLAVDGVLRGSGAMAAFMSSTFSDLILRVILAFALSPVFGEKGIWYSWPIGWAVATVLSTILYTCGVWKKKKAV